MSRGESARDRTGEKIKELRCRSSLKNALMIKRTNTRMTLLKKRPDEAYKEAYDEA